MARHSRRWLGLLAVGLATLATLSCRPGEARGPSDLAQRPIRAVATTGIVGDLVSAIGGQRVSLKVLMGPGVDPHLYKASEGDVIRLQEADLIFYSGLHLEAKMAEVLERVHGRITTVAVTSAIDPLLLLAPPEFAGAYDPHVWFDVRLWMKAAERVRDALVDADPAHAAQYRANAEGYLGELAELDRYVRAQVDRVPARQRVLVTAHDAFNYFGKAYGFEVRGLQGISTATEAGTADVQNLAEFIAGRRIPAIFVESSVPPRTIQAVQAAVRARGFDAKVGGQLFSDALGTPGTPAGTYVGMVTHNVDTIVAALLPEAADGRGLQSNVGSGVAKRPVLSVTDNHARLLGNSAHLHPQAAPAARRTS